MEIKFTIPYNFLTRLNSKLGRLSPEKVIVCFSALLSVAATTYFFLTKHIVSYGDAESHLNIAKRVVDSLTPGFAQLGGIWLPLPHLLLMPFVYNDTLWRTGLAGGIVSGACFVVSAVYLYKTVKLLTKSSAAGLVAALAFATNLNILYLQSTPMTELPLIVFFVLSSYYFIEYLYDHKNLPALLFAGVFGFCATLSRYDGWALVLMEAGILALLHIPWSKIPHSLRQIKANWNESRYRQMQGVLVLFCTIAFFGILIWLAWGGLILGDPLYFTHSEFSAKSQQNSWFARGELPAYHNIFVSLAYYFVTSLSNIGILVFVASLVGFCYLLFGSKDNRRWFIALLLLVPFFFNVVTLFLGQSVIFIPSITPSTFEWKLFNVRYGVMMVPFAAICIAYLFYRLRAAGKFVVISLIVLQLGLYVIGYAGVISLQDGVFGLSNSTSKTPDAQKWIEANYDHGLVLEDDFARSMSIIRTPIPMKNIIYVGNKPYWEESLVAPEKYATWIVMQKDDTLWIKIYEDPVLQARLYKYFVKAYTSPDTLIFKRNPDVPESD